tara:strand:- start:1747 stop:2646 length:900 start_codon:yes stop_codon:yes gene_type:complete
MSAFHFSQQFIDVCHDIALDCQHCAENELSYIVATMETGFIKKTQMEQMITSKDSRVKKFLEDLLQKHILLIPVPEAMEVRRIITHQWKIDYKKANPNTKRFRKAFPELWQRITDDWNSYFTDGKCDWCVLHEDDDSEPEEEAAVPPMYEATGSAGAPPAYEPSPSPEPEVECDDCEGKCRADETEKCEDCGVVLRIGCANNPSDHSIFDGCCDDCREEPKCWTCDEKPATHSVFRDALNENELTCDGCYSEEYPEEQRKIFLAELEQHANEFWIDWNYEVAQGRHWQNEEWLGDFDDL